MVGAESWKREIFTHARNSFSGTVEFLSTVLEYHYLPSAIAFMFMFWILLDPIWQHLTIFCGVFLHMSASNFKILATRFDKWMSEFVISKHWHGGSGDAYLGRRACLMRTVNHRRAWEPAITRQRLCCYNGDLWSPGRQTMTTILNQNTFTHLLPVHLKYDSFTVDYFLGPLAKRSSLSHTQQSRCLVSFRL